MVVSECETEFESVEPPASRRDVFALSILDDLIGESIRLSVLLLFSVLSPLLQKTCTCTVATFPVPTTFACTLMVPDSFTVAVHGFVAPHATV